MKFANVLTPTLHWSYMPNGASPMTCDAELLILAAACVPYEGQRVLEIGTHEGKTTAYLAKLLKPTGGRIITVDVSCPPMTIAETQRGECLPMDSIGKSIPSELRDVVDQVIINPNDPAALRIELETRYPFDVVFIDGDHSYEGVKRDYDTVKGMLKLTSVILIHDVWWDVNPPMQDGPLRLINEIEGYVLNMTHMGCDNQSLVNLTMRCGT